MTFEFSKAAKLYAEKVDLVKAMEQEFSNSVLDFLAGVEAEVRSKVDDQEFSSQRTSVYTYWWLSDGESQKDDNIQIWFETRQPEIVTERKLSIKVGSSRATPDVQRVMAAAWQDSRVKTFARASSKPGQGWWMFEATIGFDGESPVQTAAEQVVLTFEAIRARCSSASQLRDNAPEAS